MIQTGFLIDECVSADLIEVANIYNHWGMHVGRSRSLRSLNDWDLTRNAVSDNLVFVTNNARDFISLYSKINLHSGFIVILPTARKEVQCAYFEDVLKRLESENDISNRIVRVELDGRITIEDWPR